jgi:multidrug resistance efflux pump
MNLGDFVRAAGYRPALRNDIKFYKGSSVDVVVVHDPVRDRRFELYETECMVAREMNGARDLDTITRLAQKHVPWATRIHVEKLAIQFAGMGLLSDIPAAMLARPSGKIAVPQREPVFEKQDGETPLIDVEIPPDRSDGLDDWTELADPAIVDTFTVPDPVDLPINPLGTQRAPLIAPLTPAPAPPPEPAEVRPFAPIIRKSGDYAAYSKNLIRRTPVSMPAQPPPDTDNTITPVTAAAGDLDDSTAVMGADAFEALENNTATPVGPTRPSNEHIITSASTAHRQQTPLPHAQPMPIAPRPSAPAPMPQPVPQPVAQPAPQPAPPPPPPAPVPLPKAEVKQAPLDLGKGKNEESWEVVKQRWYRRHPKKTVLLVLVGIIAILGVIPYPLYVTETCVIMPKTHATVRSQIEGIIGEILVKEGDRVEVGTPLAKLDDRDLSYGLRQAEANVERMTATLAKVRSGNRPEEIRAARAQVSAKAQDVKFAQSEANRQSKLFKQGVASAAARDEAVRDLGVKRSALAEAAAELRLIESGSRSEEVTIAEADLRKAEAEVAFLKKKMVDLVIRAPVAGHVLTPKLHERLHERVVAGGELCEIGASDVMRVEVLVPEQEADVIALDQPVEVKVKSYPLEVFEGKIILIAPAVILHEGRRILRVEAEVQNKNNLLRPRMTGYAEIDAGDRTILTRLVRSAVRWVRVRFLI